MSSVLTRAVGQPRPAIQVRSAPSLEPPFDDESPSPAWAGPGRAEQLILEWHRRRPAPGDPAPGDPLSTPGQPGRPPGAPAVASAESGVAVRRFMALCLEIFNGYRPTGHVRALTSPTAASGVVEQLTMALQRVAALRRRAQGPGSSRPVPVGLGRVLMCEPRGGVVEAAAVLHAGGRALALALRLELRHGRWLCTAARAV